MRGGHIVLLAFTEDCVPSAGIGGFRSTATVQQFHTLAFGRQHCRVQRVQSGFQREISALHRDPPCRILLRFQQKSQA